MVFSAAIVNKKYHIYGLSPFLNMSGLWLSKATAASEAIRLSEPLRTDLCK